MTRKEAHADARVDVPHSNALVRGASEEVIRIGVEFHALQRRVSDGEGVWFRAGEAMTYWCLSHSMRVVCVRACARVCVWLESASECVCVRVSVDGVRMSEGV